AFEGRPLPPADLTMRVLLHDDLFVKRRQGDPMDEHHWAEIARLLVAMRPETALDLMAGGLCRWEHYGDMFSSTNERPLDVLNHIVTQWPDEAWARIRPLLADTRTIRAYRIMTWLQGHRPGFTMKCGGPLPMLHRGHVWAWIDEDVNERAAFIARYTP